MWAGGEWGEVHLLPATLWSYRKDPRTACDILVTLKKFNPTPPHLHRGFNKRGADNIHEYMQGYKRIKQSRPTLQFYVTALWPLFCGLLSDGESGVVDVNYKGEQN